MNNGFRSSFIHRHNFIKAFYANKKTFYIPPFYPKNQEVNLRMLTPVGRMNDLKGFRDFQLKIVLFVIVGNVLLKTRFCRNKPRAEISSMWWKLYILYKVYSGFGFIYRSGWYKINSVKSKNLIKSKMYDRSYKYILSPDKIIIM